MLAVGIKELKARLSEFLRYVAAGEVVFVTDRERIVAELRAPRRSSDLEENDAAILELFKKGILSPPVDRKSQLPSRTSRPLPKVSLLKDLLEDRDSR